MTIHEFGKKNKQVVVLIHPSIVMLDYFEYVIPLLEKKYHVIVPAIPGYDPDEKAAPLRVGCLGGAAHRPGFPAEVQRMRAAGDDEADCRGERHPGDHPA